MPKRTLKAIEVVKCIREGVDDAGLMERFKLSARGLQQLLEQLQASGLVDGPEMEARAALSSGSVIVDVDRLSLEDAPPISKPVIDALEALNHLRAGMDERGLMQRYGLSAKGVRSLLTKLAAAGAISHAELQRRFPLHSEAFLMDEAVQQKPRAAAESMSVDPNEVVRLVRSGADGEALMERLGLSWQELSSAIETAAKQGLISRSELSQRLEQRQRYYEIKRRSSDEVVFRGKTTTFGALVEKAISSGVDLSGVDLSGKNLAKLSCSGANLSGADLSHCILIGADFMGAKLGGARLVAANLSRSILYRTDLRGADLSEADLTLAHAPWAFLAGAKLSEADLTDADFSGANLMKADFTEALLMRTNLTGAYLNGANVELAKILHLANRLPQ